MSSENDKSVYLPGDTPSKSSEDKDRLQKLVSGRRVPSANAGAAGQPKAAAGGNLEIQLKRLGRDGGNFLLSFGFQASGKTVFQSHLIRYLRRHPDFFDKMTTGDLNDAAHRQMATWMANWEQDALPIRTKMTEEQVVELNFTIGYGKRLSNRLHLTMLELSGEDLKTIVPGADPVRMFRPVHDYLSNTSIKFILALIVDPEHNEDIHGAYGVAANDIMFSTLLDYLETNFENISNRLSIIMLLSKPHLALEAMRNDKELSSKFPELTTKAEMDANLLHAYFLRFAGTTYRKVSAWKGKNAVVKLDIGEVVDGYLQHPRFDDIGRIYEWIHRTFTGRQAGPGRLLRIIRWLSQ